MKDEEIEQLRQRLAEHSYTLEKITPFKDYDRITFGNKDLKVSINLRGKLADFTLEAIIKACIGKEGYQ